MKNKKGKVLIFGLVIIILLGIVLLMFITSGKIDKFGSLQKQIIDSVNEKDSLLLYLDTSADLAQKQTTQSYLAKNAGFRKIIDTSDPSSSSTACGEYIYPLLSDAQGNICIEESDYEEEYLDEFKDKLLSYTLQHPDLNGRSFDSLTIKGGYIVSIADKVSHSIVKEKQDATSGDVTLPEDSSDTDINLEIQQVIREVNQIKSSGYSYAIAERIKKLDYNNNYLKTGADTCAAFVKRLLRAAYFGHYCNKDYPSSNCNPELSTIGLEHLDSQENGGSNDAWDIAASYLVDSQTDYLNRVVFVSVPGEKDYDTLKNYIEPGDLLFITGQNWCRWSGYNYYKYESESEYEWDYCYMNKRVGSAYAIPESSGFCEKGTFSGVHTFKGDGGFTATCNFLEDRKSYKDYPIITHIFIALDRVGASTNIANAKNIKVANSYSRGGITTLGKVLSDDVKDDGIRLIIRPDYPKP